MNVERLVAELEARGVSPQDLEDTVEALVRDRMVDLTTRPLADEGALAALAQASAAETETLTEGGLTAQVSWLSGYYGNADHLYWALSGFLRLPKVAQPA